VVREYRPAPMSLAQRAALRSQQPRNLRQPARRRFYPLVALVVVLVVLVVAGGVFEYYYRDRVYPNVYIQPAGIAVGGQTQGEVMANLHDYGLGQLYRDVTISWRNHAPIQVQAHTLGYTFDRGLTAFHAVRTGRDGGLPHQAAFQLGLLTHSVDVPAVQRVDKFVLRDYLFKLSGATNRRPGPGVVGYQLDVARAQSAITRGLLRSGPFKVNLPVNAIPALPKPTPTPIHHNNKKSR
jgi:hypothetical protein